MSDYAFCDDLHKALTKEEYQEFLAGLADTIIKGRYLDGTHTPYDVIQNKRLLFDVIKELYEVSE